MIRNINNIFLNVLVVVLPASFFISYYKLSIINIAIKIILITLLLLFSFKIIKNKNILSILLAILFVGNFLYTPSNSILMWITGVIAYLIIFCLPEINSDLYKPDKFYLNFSFYLFLIFAIFSFFVSEKRLTHPYLNPNSVGLWISGLLLYHLTYFPTKNKIWKIRFLVLVFFLILTQSRSAIIAFIIPLIIYLNYVKDRNLNKYLFLLLIIPIAFYVFWYRGDFLYQIFDPEGGRYQMYLEFLTRPVTFLSLGNFGYFTNSYVNICHLLYSCKVGPGGLDSFYLSALGNGGLILFFVCIYCILIYIKKNSYGNLIIFFMYSFLFIVLGFTQAFNESFSFLIYIFGLTFFSFKVFGQNNVIVNNHSNL